MSHTYEASIGPLVPPSAEAGRGGRGAVEERSADKARMAAVNFDDTERRRPFGIEAEQRLAGGWQLHTCDR